jgi:hypothetical protein
VLQGKGIPNDTGMDTYYLPCVKATIKALKDTNAPMSIMVAVSFNKGMNGFFLNQIIHIITSTVDMTRKSNKESIANIYLLYFLVALEKLSRHFSL